jgi:predicted ATPase
MKVNSVALQEHVDRNIDCKVRVLGPKVAEISQESPPSLLVEDNSGDILEKLERRVLALEQNQEVSAKRIKSLEKDRKMFMLF